MKKVILILILISFKFSFSQSVFDMQLLQKAQDTINQSLRVINTTDVKTASYSTSLSLTYSVANAFIQGTTTANTWSIALGSNYYSLESLFFADVGGNNGGGRGIYIFNDTVKPAENTTLYLTEARWQKLIHYFPLNISGLTNNGILYSCTGTNSNSMNNLIAGAPKLFTGNLYFYMVMITAGTNLAGQKEYVKMTFCRKR